MISHDGNTILFRRKALIFAENVLYKQKNDGIPANPDAPPGEPSFWGLSKEDRQVGA
jgi:hypothetical protein